MKPCHREHQFASPRSGVSRRAVAQGILGGGLLSALPWAFERHNASARATATADEPGPDRYVLQGRDLEIVFRPGRAARLDYHDAEVSLSFVGDELDHAHVWPFGWTVTVLLEIVDDGYDRYLTLLAPAVNQDASEPAVPIHTLAIVTSHWTTDGGPILVEGAMQTYEAVPLDGTAEFDAHRRLPRHRPEVS